MKLRYDIWVILGKSGLGGYPKMTSLWRQCEPMIIFQPPRIRLKKAVALQNESFDYNGFDMLKASVGYMNEAEYQGKKVSLNKPKRGGSKKFYVYVKSKKGNVKKVSFGDTGLSVKLKQRGARASFAARHKCSTKKDKTKAGYWSCNIGRYWKSLGGGSNFSGYW